MHGFSFYGSIDAQNRTLEAFFQKTVNEPQDFWGSLGAELTTECDSLDEPIEGEPYDWLTPLLIKTPELTIRSFTLNMDEEYNIAADSRDLGPYDTGIEGLLYSSLDWEDIPAEHPPDEETQAAVPSWVRDPS